MDQFASHLILNKKIIDFYGQLTEIMEIGGGTYSTEFFLKHAKHVITVEQGCGVPPEQNEKFLAFLKSKYNNNPNWTLIHQPFEWNPEVLPMSADYIFVDGRGEARVNIILHMLKNNKPIIGAHDTEQPAYGWNRIKCPPNYKIIQMRNDEAWTTIWTSDMLLAEYLLQDTNCYPENSSAARYI